MSATTETFDWFYIGHYGQLGPLSLQQLEELVVDGVIERDTLVWSPQLPTWSAAATVPQLGLAFSKVVDLNVPPPVPPPPLSSTPVIPQIPQIPQAPMNQPTFAVPPPPPATAYAPQPMYLPPTVPMGAPVMQVTHHHYVALPQSDKNRILAGILQIFLPGVGRMYLGYAAQGVIQLLTAFCGVGAIWSFIDGIVMLCGGVKLDGYGRELKD